MGEQYSTDNSCIPQRANAHQLPYELLRECLPWKIGPIIVIASDGVLRSNTSVDSTQQRSSSLLMIECICDITNASMLESTLIVDPHCRSS